MYKEYESKAFKEVKARELYEYIINEDIEYITRLMKTHVKYGSSATLIVMTGDNYDYYIKCLDYITPLYLVSDYILALEYIAQDAMKNRRVTYDELVTIYDTVKERKTYEKI